MNKGPQKAHGIASPVCKRMYTIREAAVYLGLSVYTIRSLIWSGALPFMKVEGGRKQLLDVYDLDAYISRHKTSHLSGAV